MTTSGTLHETRSSQRGFTLVELVDGARHPRHRQRVRGAAVCSTTQSFSERGYADEIADSLRYARRIAVASVCNVRFTVNAAGLQRRAAERPMQHRRRVGRAVQSPDRALLANATPAGVAVGAAVVEFRANGELVNPVAPFIVGPFTVTVIAATGAVTVQ